MFGEGQSNEKSAVCQVNVAMREWLYGHIALSGKLQERHLQGSFEEIGPHWCSWPNSKATFHMGEVRWIEGKHESPR
jgi:hypothetical protein